jgi:hypothetical protein
MARTWEGATDIWFMFCTELQLSAGDALMQALWHTDASYDAFSAGFQLSSDGLSPVTHRAFDTPVDPTMNAGIISAIDTGTPWMVGYKESDGWTFETALSDMGLQVIESVP